MQGGPRTEPEPHTGTIFPGTETGAAGTNYQEPKQEAEPHLSLLRYGNTEITLSSYKPSEPKTGTARTVPKT